MPTARVPSALRTLVLTRVSPRNRVAVSPAAEPGDAVDDPDVAFEQVILARDEMAVLEPHRPVACFLAQQLVGEIEVQGEMGARAADQCRALLPDDEEGDDRDSDACRDGTDQHHAGGQRSMTGPNGVR